MTTVVKPADVIDQYYRDNPIAYSILVEHSRLVTKKALAIARSLQQRGLEPDLDFIGEAAMLHDIGMIFTLSPKMNCHGDAPYLQHGIIGAGLLTRLGLKAHARVCERHTGVGVTTAEIIQHGLPLPPRDLQPETLEEKIICYADLFYSKDRGKLHRQKSVDEIRRQLAKYGHDKVDTFNLWQQDFEPET